MKAGPGPRHRQARIATYTSFAVQGLCFASLVTRVPRLQDEHALSDAAMSVVLLLVPVIAGLGSVLAGAAFRRYGSGPVLRVAQPACCLVIALLGLTGGRDLALFVLVAMFGLTVGAVDAGMNAQAVAVERRYGISLITGFHAVWSIAGIAGALWAALASSLDWSLFTGFAVPAAVGIAAALIAGPRLYDRSGEGHGGLGAGLDAAMRAAERRVPWRPIIVVGAAMGIAYLADAALSTYGTVFMTDQVGATASVAPLAYVAYQLAMVVGRGVADLWVRRSGAVLVVRVGALVGLVGMAAMVAAPSPSVAIAAFAVAGLGLSVVAPVAFTAAGRVDPTGLGVAVARVNIFNYVGFVAGAAVVGAIAPLSRDDGLRWAFAVPAVLVIGIFALARGFEPDEVPGVDAAPAGELTGRR